MLTLFSVTITPVQGVTKLSSGKTYVFTSKASFRACLASRNLTSAPISMQPYSKMTNQQYFIKARQVQNRGANAPIAHVDFATEFKITGKRSGKLRCNVGKDISVRMYS